MPKHFVLYTIGALLWLTSLAACGQSTAMIPEHKLRIVATTSIVGDVVQQIAGESVSLTILLPVGVDPHSFQPTPQDIAKINAADLVFMNGAGLEEFMHPLIESASPPAQIVSVSEGITLLKMQAGDHSEHQEEGDPHLWFDPNNVITWTHNIEKALIEADPDHATQYRAHAESYRLALIELDRWVQEQVAQVAPGNRRLVTDHLTLGYFAARYGFEQAGAVIPSYSTLAEPTAQELAALEDVIRRLGVKAVLVGESFNPTLAQRVAEDTGVRLVTFYHGSLSAADGPASNYLDYIRYNVTAIVEALK
jgi:ABC-type Zn uptake system ZnuABC Zn-binding protein ZnuA